jgi:uncharacterized Zn finger protein
MALKTVECLSCGATRSVVNVTTRSVPLDECQRCGYVGWAETTSLTEALRRALRDRTVDRRRSLVVW